MISDVLLTIAISFNLASKHVIKIVFRNILYKKKDISYKRVVIKIAN